MFKVPRKILVLHSVTEDFGVPQNYLDFVDAFHCFSQNEIYYLNPLQKCLTLEQVNFFDVIVIHHSIIVFAEAMLPYFWRVLIRNSTCKKILFVQDDFRRVDHVVALIHFMGIQVLFTIVPDQAKDEVYVPGRMQGVKIISILTSYVPEHFKQKLDTPFEDRIYDVVYRGRKSSAWYGDLVREKWIIGEKFAKDAAQYHLNINSSSRENDRIYGEKWFSFLSSAKAVLGTESSSNVVDFSGEIERKTLEHEKAFPDTSYETLKYLYFNEVDGKIKLNTLSPKMFEYAATRTLMILYEGEYSGVITPWVHYIPLKKDHSNMDQIIPFLKNKEAWKKITDRAYDDLILSPKYSYASLAELFDAEVAALLGDDPQLSNDEDPGLPQNLNVKICAELPPQKKNYKIIFMNFLRAVTPPFVNTLRRHIIFLYQGVRICLENNKGALRHFNQDVAKELILFDAFLKQIEEIFKKTNILYIGKNADQSPCLRLENKNGAYDILVDCEKEWGLTPPFQNFYDHFKYSDLIYRTFMRRIKALGLDQFMQTSGKI